MAQNSFLNTFVRHNTGIAAVEAVQDNLENAFAPIENCPLLNGHLLEGIELKNGDNYIDHKLGRDLKGWFITRHRETASNIIDRQTTHTGSDSTLLLNSSVGSTITVDIWVF